MVNVLIRHNVVDLPRWKQIFDSNLSMRKAGGELEYRIFHNHANPTDLFVLCEFETLEMAKRYFASDALKKAMTDAGVTGTPEVIFLDEVRSFHRTAAD